jgi:S-adenosylmethionine synthetase
MFGYACRETPELMPLPISLAHKITAKLAEVRKNGTVPFLRPDGKAQVSVKYIDGKPVSIDTIVVSTQHHDDISQDVIKEAVIEEIIKKVIPSEMMSEKIEYFIKWTYLFSIYKRSA